MNDLRGKIRKNLLPLILAGLGVMAGASMSFGAVAFDADFSTYTLGTLNGQNSWAQIGTSNTKNPIQVIAASGVVPQSIRVTGVASAANSYRNLPTYFNSTTVTEATTFYYVLENFKVIAALNSSSSTGQGFCAFTATAGGTGSTAARLFLRRFGGVAGNTTTFDLGVSASGATAVYGTTALAVGTLYKIVVAYTANPGSANDVVKVYVNPVGLDPTAWSHEVTQTATTDPTASFKSLQITPGAVSSNTKIDLTIGRIIVGDSPSDVLLPAAPAVSVATGITPSGFTANWGASAGATKYYLDVATDSGFTTYVAGFENLDVLTAVSKSVTGTFTPGQSVFYRVRASNSNGTSVNSATQEVVITSAPVVLVPTVTNSATSGTVTWTSGPDWIPNNPVSASNATVTFNGVLNGVLTANNDSASPFVLNSLVFANSGAGTNDITGGVLQLTSNGTTNPKITFANNSTYQRVSAPVQLDTNVTVSQSGSTASNSILAGVVSGVGGLTKSGAGYVYLTQSNNSFGGPVTIGNGTLVPENIGLAGQNSSLGTNGTINLGGGSLAGTLRWGSGSVTNEATDKSFALAGSTGGGTIDVRGTTSLLTLNGAIDTGANASTRFLTLTGEGGVTVNGLISGNGGLRVNGSKGRTVILANAGNSFGGPVTIDGNIAGQSYRVQVASIGNAGLNSPLGTNSTINIGTSVGSFNFLVWSNTVAETTDKTINLAGTVGGALIANKGSALLKFTAPVTATGVGAKTFYPDQDDVNGVTEFAGSIPDSSSGAITIKKGGAGKLVLSAANTFTGGVRFSGGTLELGNPSALAAGNYLKYESQASGTALVKVAYAAAGPDLGNLEVDVNGTLDLGTDNTAQIRFATATGWAAGTTLTITNSTGGGKLYILDSTGLVSTQIVSAENPTYSASIATDGLVTFTAPAQVGSTFTNWLGATPATSDLLLQYAFGAVSPTQPVAPAYLPQASVTETGGVRSLVLTYYVRQGTQGLSVKPEFSTDLSAENGGFAESDSITKSDHEISEVGGVSVKRWTASVPIESGAAKKFLRVKVTQN